MKVIIAGDYVPTGRVSQSFEKSDFNSINGVRPYVNGCNYSILNMECPVVEEPGTPIVKQGPNLYCSIKGIEALKYVGFNCVTLANNHLKDYGDSGVKSTLDACKKYNLDTVGGGKDLSEATQILYKKMKV